MRSKRVKALLFLTALFTGISVNINNAYAVDDKYDTVMEAVYATTYKDIFYDKTAGSPLEYEAEDGVDTATGHLSLQRCDLYLEGTGGMDFALSRFYNSNDANIGHPTSKQVDEIDVDNIYVKFKGEDGKTHSMTVASDIYKNHKTALKDMLYNYTKGDQARDDEVKDTQKTKVVNGIPYNVYGISTGWSFDFPWIETMSIKEGDESKWAPKPVYLHFGSKGSMAIATKAKKKKKTYKITGFEGYDYSDIKLENISKKVDGVKCKYLLRDKTGMRTYFNADGVVVLQKDAHNNTIKYTYRDKIYFNKITDSVGREIVFHYGEEKNGMRFLEKVTVQGKKVKGGVSAKTIKYAISETSYTPKNGKKIYGSVLDSVTVDGTKEKYGYRTVETFVNTSGYLIAGHRADTNQAYLINSVESEGCRTCYEYRAGAIRGTRDAGEGQKRDVATQFYYVTREYDQDVKTGKKANGIKYDYFQKQKGENNLTTYFDFSNGTQARQYGEDSLSNVTVETSYNPKKHKDNGLVSDYTYKVDQLNFSSMHLKKQPDKNVSLSIYNTNKLLTDEVEEGKEKSETLYSYDKNGKGSLVVLETNKKYGYKSTDKTVTSKSSFSYNKYRNLTTKTAPQAFADKNSNKKQLYTVEYEYFENYQDYPDDESKNYNFTLEKSCENYVDSSTILKVESILADNGVDINSTSGMIRKENENYVTKNKIVYSYDSSGNKTAEKLYPRFENSGIKEFVKKRYEYNSLGQRFKENIEIHSDIDSSQNRSYTNEELTYDSFGNELTCTDMEGTITNYTYDENGDIITTTDAVGTDFESKNKEYKSEDSLKTMFIDEFGMCDIEISDSFGNVVISKNEKSGIWTERDYDYDIENEQEGEGRANLLEERTYEFNPLGEKIIINSNGDEEGNYDIEGKGEKILSGSRYMYNQYDEIIISADFMNGNMDSEHCSSWELKKSTENIEDGKVVQTLYSKSLNPLYYTKNYSEDNYYNQFDEFVLVETIEKSIMDEEGNNIQNVVITKSKNQILTESTTFVYDDFGRIQEEVTTIKKEKDGRELSEKVSKKNYKYDYMGNVTEIARSERKDVNSPFETYIQKSIYDDQGKLIRSYDAKGVKENYATIYTYDLAGRLIQTMTPIENDNGVIEYNITKCEYADNGNITAMDVMVSNDEFERTEYEYNAIGKLILVKKCLEDGKSQYTQYLYDKNGNKIRQYTGMTSPLTILLKENEGGNDIYSYINKTYSVEVSGKAKRDTIHESKFEYNKKDELICYIDPEGRKETYTYDALGNQLTTTDKNGNSIVNVYDIQNRIIRQTATTKETGDVVSHTYQYNEYGDISKIDNTTYYYDDITGDITKEKEDDGIHPVIEKNYQYDVMGNPISFNVEIDGKKQLNYTYNYDAFERLEMVKQAAEGEAPETVVTYNYDVNGNLKEALTETAELKTSYSYNLVNEVTEMINSQGESYSKNISEFHNKYLKSGQKSSEENFVTELQQDGKNGKKLEKRINYTYDKLGRLIRESRSGEDDICFTYDANNNRTQMTEGEKVTNYYYNKNDELLREDTLDSDTLKHQITLYKNDKNGNQLSTVNRKKTDNDKTMFDLDISLGDNRLNDNVVNHYDALDQLTLTLTKDKKVSYQYNAAGLRTEKNVNGKTTKYVWDGDQLVLELDENYNVKKRYIRGNNLVYADEGVGTEKTFYVMNSHGDVVQLVNENGDLVKCYEYDSFGNEMAPDDKDTNPFRYAGEYYDVETGEVYLRARYYSPQSGRFLTRDSYTGEDEEPLSLNLYTYCENDPVLQADYDGNMPDVAKAWDYIQSAGKKAGAYIKKEANAGWEYVKSKFNKTVENGKKKLDAKVRAVVSKIQSNPRYKLLMADAALATMSGGLDKPLEFFDFYNEYDKKTRQKVYYTSQKCWQTVGGYNDFYDYVFDVATDMDRDKIEFQPNQREKYIVWMWKGDYLNLGAGSEVGIYKNVTGGLWKVDRDYSLKMTLSLKWKDTLLYNRKPTEPNWWITGFVPAYQGVKEEDLTMKGSLKFNTKKTKGLWKSFRAKALYSDNHKSKWKDKTKKRIKFRWK